ncbi:cytochrome c [Singulisphaera rosea]
MQRKWWTLFAAMVSVSMLAVGISMADEESELHQLMEKVGPKSNAIKKALRTPVAYKKGQKDLAKITEELIELAKKNKDLAKDGAKKAKGEKDPEKKWVEINDVFTKELEKFAAVIGKADTDQAAAKKAWSPVNESCTECHKVFRVDE